MTDWTLMDWIGMALSAAAAAVWIREVARMTRPKVVLSHTRYVDRPVEVPARKQERRMVAVKTVSGTELESFLRRGGPGWEVGTVAVSSALPAPEWGEAVPPAVWCVCVRYEEAR